jgi:hypothetical protein
MGSVGTVHSSVLDPSRWREADLTGLVPWPAIGFTDFARRGMGLLPGVAHRGGPGDLARDRGVPGVAGSAFAAATCRLFSSRAACSLTGRRPRPSSSTSARCWLRTTRRQRARRARACAGSGPAATEAVGLRGGTGGVQWGCRRAARASGG